MYVVAVDSETTGLDRFHGCLPYLVTTCDNSGGQRTWEVQVNPKNRNISWSRSEIGEIQSLLDRADRLVFHNSKFDMKMLAAIGIRVDHLWKKIEDTLFISHMLASQEPHDLTSTVKRYLKGSNGKGYDISPYEEKMQGCVQAARRWCRSHLKDWKLATEGMVNDDGFQLMPSTKGSNDKTGRAWMADTWLPKAVALHEGPSWVKGHQNQKWLTVTDDYADIDSSCLIPLFDVMMKEVKRRKLEKNYRERLRILPAIHRMEHYGTTYKLDTHVEMKGKFTERVSELEGIIYGIAECYNYPLKLPKRARNKSLDTFVFETMKLPVLALSDAGNPVFDADIKEEYELTLPTHSMERAFIKALNEKGEYDTALGYMDAYERFCIKDKQHVLKTSANCGCTKGTDEKCPVCEWGASVCSVCGKAEVELDEPCIGGKYATLYPNLNPTGTVGLRFSHTNPNSANVSKHKKTNLRKNFGPRDKRIWYSCDYTNIELVVPAFEVDEKELVHIFTYPDEPPFYGSFHMVMFSALWPDVWADAIKKFGPEGAAKFCKSEYEDTYYGATKNFDFATQYGCQEKKANLTAGHPNAFRLKAERCPKIDALAKKLIREAEKNNCVTTIPDKTIDSERGFPIQAKRGHWGKVQPTTPLCYHVSSTAAQVLNRAMVMCDERLMQWRTDGFDAWMILTIHDELVFDMPLRLHPIKKVISGGQTGSDQGGIFAAKKYGIPTGGWIVKGWKTENGRNESLRDYGLVETETIDYPTRTKANVRDSDGTIRIAKDFGSAGERCTMNAIREMGKPHIDISLNNSIEVLRVVEWVKKNSISVLNVAGNCESTETGMSKFAEDYVTKVLTALDPMRETDRRANELRNIMESASSGIDIPIRVSVERHPIAWSDGEVVPKEVK